MDLDEDFDDVKSGGFERVRKAVEVLTRQGFSAGQLLTQLHDILILSPIVSALAKAKISLILGETDKCLTDGADEELQLLSACARIRAALLV